MEREGENYAYSDSPCRSSCIGKTEPTKSIKGLDETILTKLHNVFMSRWNDLHAPVRSTAFAMDRQFCRRDISRQVPDQSHMQLPSVLSVLKRLPSVSFNTQSQTPDIPGISSCVAFSQYSVSLQGQSKAPDNHLLSLCESTEELLSSFNAQDQAPDHPYDQDRQCAPCDSKIHSITVKCSQGCLYGFPPSPVKCPSTYFLVLFIFHFAPHIQDYRLHHERSLT